MRAIIGALLWAFASTCALAQVPHTFVNQQGYVSAQQLDDNFTYLNQGIESVDVRRFGAKCDGSTNDSTAIQNAINYLSAAGAGSGRVVIPPTPNGCVASVTINTANNITLSGSGYTVNAAGGSKLIAPSLTSSIVTVGKVGGFAMENLQLLGAATSPSQITSSVPPLLSLNQSVDAVFHNVSVGNGYDLVKFNNTAIVRWYGGNLRDFTHTAMTITGNTGVVAGGGNDYYIYGMISDQDSAAYENVGTLAANIYIDQNGGSITIDGADLLHGHAGIWVNPGSGQFVQWIYATNIYLDNCDYTGTTATGATTAANGNTYVTGAAGLKVTPNGGGKVYGLEIDNAWSSTCLNAAYLTGDSSSTLSVVNLSNLQSLNIGGSVVYTKYATDVNISNPMFAGGSQLSIGNYPGVELDTGSNNVSMTGGRIGSPVEGFGATMKFGLQFDAGFTGKASVSNLNLTGNFANAVFNNSTSTGIDIRQSQGFNPQGTKSITPSASPWTYQAGISPESVYLTGGSVSLVTMGGLTICTSSPCAINLQPSQSVQVTYSSAPTAVTNQQ